MTTAAPPRGCCAGRRPSTLSEYIDRGMRRARAGEPPTRGAECSDDQGHVARFGVDVTGDVVTAVGFRASPCATLLAYCEVAAERVTGRPLAAAVRALRPDELAAALPSVPAAKRARASLASQALLRALAVAARDVHP